MFAFERLLVFDFVARNFVLMLTLILFMLYFQRGAFVSEPAILVRRVNSGSQVWSMEKLENKLVDMRDMYQEYKERLISGRVSITICTKIAHSTHSFIACDVADVKLTPTFFSLSLFRNYNISMLIFT